MAKEGNGNDWESFDFGSLDKILKYVNLASLQAKPASPSDPANIAGMNIPGFEPAQQQQANTMSYGMMNNIMARIMNPQLNATNPLMTSNAYARPVLSSPQFPAPGRQQAMQPPVSQGLLNFASQQGGFQNPYFQNAMTPQQFAGLHRQKFF